GRPPGRSRIATREAARAAPWRSPSGAIEDRNTVRAGAKTYVDEWRSPSGAIEDRNEYTDASGDRLVVLWRSPSGATEDRNHWGEAVAVAVWCGGRPPGRSRIATFGTPWPALAATRVAVAPQGGRGSQRRNLS
ncbi:hypothetical protein, partial [Streptomyces goshikiensis]